MLGDGLKSIWYLKDHQNFRSKLLTKAITRKVSPAINNCELTHLARTPIDLELANLQHKQYEQCLIDLGCQVNSLPAELDLPDSVFVEDTAIVFDELAIITRPGAESRRKETLSIAQALSPYRQLHHIKEPATIDGGDVLVVAKQVFVGLSSRTNNLAITLMQQILSDYGYSVIGIPISSCLHLKSAVTFIGNNTLLVNPNLIDVENFRQYKIIEVDTEEPLAANSLIIDNTLIFPSNYPKTKAILQNNGFKVISLDVSEIIKAEGAVTCCSLIFK